MVNGVRAPALTRCTCRKAHVCTGNAPAALELEEINNKSYIPRAHCGAKESASKSRVSTQQAPSWPSKLGETGGPHRRWLCAVHGRWFSVPARQARCPLLGSAGVPGAGTCFLLSSWGLAQLINWVGTAWQRVCVCKREGLGGHSWVGGGGKDACAHLTLLCDNAVPVNVSNQKNLWWGPCWRETSLSNVLSAVLVDCK